MIFFIIDGFNEKKRTEEIQILVIKEKADKNKEAREQEQQQLRNKVNKNLENGTQQNKRSPLLFALKENQKRPELIVYYISLPTFQM